MKFLNNVADTHAELIQLEAHDDKFMEAFILNNGGTLVDPAARTYHVMRCTADEGDPDHYRAGNHDETIGCGIRHAMIQWQKDVGNQESPTLAYLYERVSQSIIDPTSIALQHLRGEGAEVIVFLDYSLFYLDGNNHLNYQLGVHNSLFEFYHNNHQIIDKLPKDHPLLVACRHFVPEYREWKEKNNK